MVQFASTTGLRLAETLITWDCVNWEARAIATTGKGGRMVRTPLTEAVAAILEPLKGHHPEAVFTYVCRRPKAGHRKGERLPLTYAGAKSEWQAMRKRAGVKGFRFHDVRHDFATKLLRETGNLKLVSRALNHTDVKTTARYAHVVDFDLSEALQRLSQSKSPTESPTPKIANRRNQVTIQVNIVRPYWSSKPRVGSSSLSGRANQLVEKQQSSAWKEACRSGESARVCSSRTSSDREPCRPVQAGRTSDRPD